MLWLKTGNLALIGGLFTTFIVLTFGLIIFLSLKSREKLQSSGIAIIDQMSGTNIEFLLLEYFKKLGYRGKLTSEYEDYGADLLLLKENVRYVVQATRWNQKGGVKTVVKTVQEVVAVIKYYKADIGILITNNFFYRKCD